MPQATAKNAMMAPAIPIPDPPAVAENQYTDRLWRILACPACGHALERASDGAVCLSCRTAYNRTASGSLNLHLTRTKSYKFAFEMGAAQCDEPTLSFAPLAENPAPAVDFTGFAVPERLTRELLSYFPKAGGKESLMLDLGCGDAPHRAVCEHAGFEYVGLDREGPLATTLADAHALPFRDNSFEFVLSIAVLQYSPLPFVMMREVCRVLQPGGRFLGTVAFLEPFHETYYHHTHLGAVNSLRQGGLTVDQVAASAKWTGLAAQASMALFPRMPRPLSEALIWPIHALHRAWWSAGRVISLKANEATRIRNTTGSFALIASKKGK